MKKLFLLAFVLCAGLTTQAQPSDNAAQDWSVTNSEFTELYTLATEIGKETDKVIANGNVISIVRDSGTTSFQRVLDNSVTVEFYNFCLLTSQGQKINLNKGQAEKVVNKFKTVLVKVKESLDKDSTKAIDSILDGL